MRLTVIPFGSSTLEISFATSTKRGSIAGGGGSWRNARLYSDSFSEFSATGVIFGFSTLTRFVGSPVVLSTRI